MGLGAFPTPIPLSDIGGIALERARRAFGSQSVLVMANMLSPAFIRSTTLSKSAA